MALILITGIAGTGKTTTIEELKSRGYTAYDIDNDGFAHWQHKTTGESAGNDIPTGKRTPEFQKNYDWAIYGNKLIDLANESEDETVFLGGVADEMEQYYELFTIMLYLKVSKKTLQHRLRTRLGNDFGKSKHEFDSAMQWFGKSQELAQNAGMIFVDAEKQVCDVADEILQLSGVKS